MYEVSHLATNLALDPDLLERALAVSGERAKKAAVTKALEGQILTEPVTISKADRMWHQSPGSSP